MREFDDSAAEQSAEIPLGDEFTVSLRETPSTGFRWKLVAGGEPVCTRTGDQFEPRLAPGAAGIHRLTFRAAQAGEATIQLTLGRSWEHNVEPAKSLTLRVRVR